METDQLERLKSGLAERYRFEGVLGAGGMANVYLAEDVKHGRRVAVKVLRPEVTAALGAERFLREIRITASLDHPHILTLIDSGATGGLVWYVVPYVRGESLAQKLSREKQLGLDEAVEITRQVGSALEHAHRHGVIHRDVKPGNILLFEGEAMLADFGLAVAVKEAGGEQRLTESGITLGTLQYMSPEQATGSSDLDARADVYSLGAVLYEMLTGEPPHTGPNPRAVIAKLISQAPTDVRVLRPMVPPHLADAVMKALAAERVDRFPDVEKFLAALDRPRLAIHGWKKFYRIAATGIGGLLVAATVVLVSSNSSSPRVTSYTQLTRSRILFSPFVSPLATATDGSRIYFTEFVNLIYQPRLVHTAGGEALPFSPALSDRSFIVNALTPDRSHLVLGEFLGGERALENPFWLWPVIGGQPRRFGESEGHSLGFSPDGQTVVFMKGNDVYLARADGTQPRKLISAPGRPYWPAFSPDGRRLRFTVFDLARTGLPSLWEVAIDGTQLRRLLAGWDNPRNECCGSWTPDGKYYVFQATRGDGTHVWALPERSRPFTNRSDPVQLTTGPMNFIRPLIDPDGKRIYAVGWQLRGELAQITPQSGESVAHPGSLSAEWVAYARDRERIAYISYPEAQLWRAKPDGSDQVQLTFPPMRARRPQWSPDGRTIAFEGQVGEHPWKVYLVSPDGGAARALTTHDRLEASPTWSADGKFLAFALGGDAVSFAPPKGIRVFDMHMRSETALAGSHTVREPAWSPDGRYIASISHDRLSLRLFNVATSRWEEFARPGVRILRSYWSTDSQFLYFQTMPPRIELFRVHIGNRDVQRVGALQDRWVFGMAWPWTGVTPDGSLLYLRDQSIHHIYALDWSP